MKTNFLGAAYTLRSHPLSAQTCINLYVEPNESGNGDIGGFYGTPGKRKVLTLAATGCRGLRSAGGSTFAVYGDRVYRIGTNWSVLEVGTLPNSTGAVGMDDNGTDLVIAHAAGWHKVTLADNTFAAVPDAPTMSDVTFIDNYLVGANGDGTYQWANLNSTDIDPLSFASAEGNPDKIIRTLGDHRELWLLGTETTEVAVVTSDPDLPFTRTSFIEQGIWAPKSAAKEDNSVFWLGRNAHGQGVVFVAEGYIPRRVSTFAIEQAIAGYANPENATAHTYQQDGHHFYALCFEEATWVLDINTQLWHQRAWREPETGLLHRDRGVFHAVLGGLHLTGDWEDGRIYSLETDYYLDDEDRIYRERTWPQVEAENRLIRYDRCELIGDTGVGLPGQPLPVAPPGFFMDGSEDLDGDGLLDAAVASADTDEGNPIAWLSWSDDGGRTWSSEHGRSIGRLGDFNQRTVWRRLGKARTRYFRLRMTAAVRVGWRGFNIDVGVAKR